MDLFSRIRKYWPGSNSLGWLILINLVVFLGLALARLFFFLSGNQDLFGPEWFLAIPADPLKLFSRPWTLISYMFLHLDFFHFLFNMLVLFWFGQFFLRIIPSGNLWTIYLAGGLSGAGLFILFYNLFSVFEPIRTETIALGASASVMAILMCSTLMRPGEPFQLLFFGQVKAIYIAVGVLTLDVISIAGPNSGGHIAHIGGALWGILHWFWLKQGLSLKPVWRGGINPFQPKRPKVAYRSNLPPRDDHAYAAWKAGQQAEIDAILDKIARSGYQSLSKKEKETLFNQGK